MKFYLAPLEGLTGYIYRNAMEKYFPGVERYFTPFIAPDQNKILRTKEQRDVLPSNNEVRNLVPQILTNNAEHFIRTTEALQELGYEEVNLNLGCPSGTVVSRGRGSGFLAYPDELDRFLEQIFEGSKTRISIKTRVGRDNADDAFRLLEIYRKYPLSELIIHPRTRSEFYRGVPNLELFGEMAKWWENSFSCKVSEKADDRFGEVDEFKRDGAEGAQKKISTDSVKEEHDAFGEDNIEQKCKFCVDEARTDQKIFHRNDSGQNDFRKPGITLCYNGNIMSAKDYQTFTERFPNIDCLMLGRGAIANPGLIRQLKTGIPTDKKNLRAFHDEILEAQREMVREDKNAMFRMKEMWIYMIHLFGPTKAEIADYERIYGGVGVCGDGTPFEVKGSSQSAHYGGGCRDISMCGAGMKIEADRLAQLAKIGSERRLDQIQSRTAEKCAKKIRKAQSIAEYKCAVDQLFAECELLDHGPKKWNLPQK